MPIAIAAAGYALRVMREFAGLSRQALAEQAGVHRNTVAYWERQRRLNSESDAVQAIARVLNVAIAATGTRAGARARLGVSSKPLVSGRQVRRPAERVICGARTRAGSTCKARSVPGKRRCRLHGGLSTGPRTTEGKARLAEAMRRRWEEQAS